MSAAVLETARLRLRQYTLDDEAALYEVFGDPMARSFYPEMVERERVRAWIEWNLRNYASYGFGLWALELKDTGRFLGDCGLTYQDVEGQSELEIGYHVLGTERGNGYATEAARACLDYGFTMTESRSICSIVRPANTASCTVAGRIHVNCREVMRKGRPALVFFTTREEWKRSGGAAARL